MYKHLNVLYTVETCVVSFQDLHFPPTDLGMRIVYAPVKYLTHYYNYPFNGHIVWHISFLLLILIIVLTIYKINIIFALFFEFVVELSF